MAVRNFYIDADIPGRAEHLKGGPRNSKDGMFVKLYVREDGSITEALKIDCTVDDNLLYIRIINEAVETCYESVYRR